MASGYLYNKYYADYYKTQYINSKLSQDIKVIKVYEELYKQFEKDAAITKPIYLKMFRDYSKMSVYQQNIIYNLTVSSTKNTFEEFWDNITGLYKSSGYNNISVKEYEEMRGTNALDSFYFSKIEYAIYPRCIVIHLLDTFEVNDKFQVQLVCTKLNIYFTNLLNFTEIEKLNNKYIIQRLGTPNHAISCIISHSPYYEIAIIDPNSMLLEVTNHNITSLFKCIDNKKIKTAYGNEYTIVCPQLHSMVNIQGLLHVSSKRIGACTIIAKLIPQVMIYMKVPSLKAIQIITTTILRKILSGESIVPFADGYTAYLFNIGSYRDPRHKIPIMEDEKKPYIALAKKFFTKYGFKKPNLFSKNTDYFAVFMGELNNNKFYRNSPTRSPIHELEIPKNKKLYIDRNGFMPFKTYWPITSVPVKNMPIDKNGALALIPILEQKNAKSLITNELNAIRSIKKHFMYSVYDKIGEILYLKYGKENINKYFNQKSCNISKDKDPGMYIHTLGTFYIQELKAILKKKN